MPYLIDGHNLIPKIAGLSLAEFDDEARLIEMLQEFCRLRRKEVDVYFDNAPPGGRPVQGHGQVTAHFVRRGMTADTAIQKRLTKLGRAARNWTVVSSDAAVQAAARGSKARVLSAEAFAAQMQQALDDSGQDAGSSQEAELSADEVDEWMDLFGGSGE